MVRRPQGQSTHREPPTLRSRLRRRRIDLSPRRRFASRAWRTWSVAFQEMAEPGQHRIRPGARLYGSAHEIRTPLATLEAHIDGLEDGVLTADPHTFEVMRGQIALRSDSPAMSGSRRAGSTHSDLHLRQVRISDVVGAACQVARPVTGKRAWN